MNDLYLLAINLTKRCNLACAHCYLDADTLKNGAKEELSAKEVCQVLDQVADRDQQTMVVLTGGEPLLRPDLEEIVHHGAQRGLAMVTGTNGTLLTDRRVKSLKEAGLLGAGISVDSLEPEFHDQFRGVSGCWSRTMAGIKNCRNNDLSFQIHFSINDNNAHQLPEVIEFSRRQGARVLNVFFLICTGRGESQSDISPYQYERVLEQLVQAQAEYPDLIIRPRCAPHYKRIAYQQAPDAQINRISGNEGDGCIAATHYCRISPSGGVTACPFIEEEVGNIRDQSLIKIWDSAPAFEALRQPDLKGDCGACEYQKLCGGCRARPYALGGSLMDSDPWCAYRPQGGEVIQPLQVLDSNLRWSEDAERRLNLIPGFIRKMVRKRTEAYVQDLGENLITCDHLNQLAAKRFGKGKMPSRPQIFQPQSGENAGGDHG
ncbi:MAG: radical SAM protein [Motiliproteus sp.]|nr:radical SAM protein [Motiliproteus sp.]MCW9051864.1 radical SAM protein [Motiliproteus sp.]